MSGTSDAFVHVPTCIVTSYRRPKYLERCLESMRQSEIKLYVVDGGDRDQETLRILNRYCDDWRGLNGNPGADVLKNVGIQEFAKDPVFIITSDDFLFPPDWAQEVLDQWYVLKHASLAGGKRWGMIACPTEEIIRQHAQDPTPGGDSMALGMNYQTDLFSSVSCMQTSISMVAGTIMDTALVQKIGGFPVYGRTGQGDIAMSIELHKRQYLCGYFRTPVLQHLGRDKHSDYPEYSADFDADDALWQQRARGHKPGERNGFLWPRDLEGTALWGA